MYKAAIDAITDQMRLRFNEDLSESLLRYGITDTDGFALDFSPGSKNVAEGRYESGDFSLSRLDGRLVLVIVPNGSAYTGSTPGIKWSGQVNVRLDFKVVYSIRDGDDLPLDETEMPAIGAAIERACVDCFCTRTWPQASGLSVKPSCPEGPEPIELGDGAAVFIPISMQFHVDLFFE